MGSKQRSPQSCVGVVRWLDVLFSLSEFFEECIKEEQYEAQKLDILRDAVRAKVTYSSETKRLSANGGSPEPLETQI